LRFPFLSFAKGYAIFTIMLFHAMQRVELPGFAQKAIVFGGTGVHLFFLLSGFGLALSKHSNSVGDFYRRRIVKVWWPYAVVLTLSWGLSAGWQLFPDGGAAWLAGVLGYQMFFPAYIESFGGHFWFISAILQFYLVFPGLLWLFRRWDNGLYFVAFCVAASVMWWVLVYALDKGAVRTWNSFFMQFLWEFGLGMALAHTIKTEKMPHWIVRWWQPEKWWLWILGGLAGAAAMLLLVLKTGQLGPIFNDIPALTGYGMLCVGVYWLAVRYAPVVERLLTWLGEISFSVYLVHIIVLELFLFILRINGYTFQIFWIPLFVTIACLAGNGYEIFMKKIPVFNKNA
jgi:peptidoglycan/LPS O-acetylase OafA/YrhL